MTIKREQTQRASGRGVLLAFLRRPWAACVAALALVLQLGLGGVSHRAAAALAGELAVTALSAAVGQEVSLCAGAGGHSGAPDPSYPCCDDCALCGFACHSTALGPQRAAALFAPQRVAAAAPIPRDDAGASPPLFWSNGRPRAPPHLV